MTTTVYDRIAKAVASDSRWSCKLDNKGYAGHILYVDDVGFGKIAFRKDTVIVLSGNGYLIELWKKWLLAREIDPNTEIPPTHIAGQMPLGILIIELSSNRILFGVGRNHTIYDHEVQEVLATFSGSGEAYAAINWNIHTCVKQAIECAKNFDPYSGGSVRFFNFSDGSRDIETGIDSIQEVKNIMLERGYIMDTTKPNAAPVSISAQEVADVRELLANGSLTPSAPVGVGVKSWDDASQEKLKQVLLYIRDAEAKLEEADA